MILQEEFSSSNFTGPHFQAQLSAEKVLRGISLDPELAALVSPHWLSFPESGDEIHLILGFLYILLTVFGVFGNLTVLYVFMTKASLRTSSNLLIANQSMLDGIMVAHIFLFLANTFTKTFVFGTTGCNIYASFGSVSGIGSAVNNVIIAFDRYRTISNPMEGRMSMGKAAILAVFVWVWAMPFTVMPAFRIWNGFSPEGILTTCSFDYLTESQETKVFTLAIFMYAYFLPVFILVILYARIVGLVAAHSKMLADQAKKMGVKSLSQGKEDETAAEIKIAKVACTIFALFLMGWTPYAIVALIGCFGNKAILTPILSTIPAVAAKSMACINPWVYAISHPKFREGASECMPFIISPLQPKVKPAAASDTQTEVSKE